MKNRILVVCTTDSMIWNFLIPHIKELEKEGCYVECACSITGDFYNKLIDLYDIKMNEIPFARSPYNINNFNAFKNLRKLIKKKKFDTVYCHEPVGGALGRIVGHMCKCKVIYIAHGFHFYKGAPLINKTIYYLVEMFLARYTDVLITINEEDYRASLKFKAKKKYKINGIGIDTQKFVRIDKCDDLRHQLKLKPDDFILFSVGELIERKNHIVIIEALKYINNQNIHYVIAGEGELYNFLKDRIQLMGLERHVHLLGYRTDINRLCNAADVYVMPSLQEGLSVALMEAMSCAKPIIASKIRGNIDLVENKIGGILVDSRDIVGFADAILYCYKCRDTLLNYGQHNFEKIKEFDISKVKEQLDLIYRECLEG